MSTAEPLPPPERRSFLKRFAAIAIGTVVGLVPLAAGLATFFHPLRSKKSERGLVKVTTLKALPSDGVPRKFSIIADRNDAWTTFPKTPIGAIYLRRNKNNSVEAFNVVCPHAGCAVDYQSDRKSFLCPCHNSTFAIDGSINDPNSPSARGLDSLVVELRGEEIWVRFQNFQPGKAEKVPIA